MQVETVKLPEHNNNHPVHRFTRSDGRAFEVTYDLAGHVSCGLLITWRDLGHEGKARPGDRYNGHLIAWGTHEDGAWHLNVREATGLSGDAKAGSTQYNETARTAHAAMMLAVSNWVDDQGYNL